jgi:DNA-nicking Smr family endonuclease
MPRRPRPLTDHDQAAWAAFARHVRVLPGRPMPELPEPPPAATAPPAAPASPAPSRPRTTPAPTLRTGIQPPGLDNASWGRLRTGKLAPQRTLDLHGRSAQSAYHALERFLHAAHADRLRCVEVITGRGSGEHGGVIRRELPLWLNLPNIRPLVLAASFPHPSNEGATRLLLRRAR